MIAVAFALPAESFDFVKLIEGKHRTSRGIIGRLNDKEICVLHIGVGARVANNRLGAFFSDPPLPRLMISAGFAGALDDRLAIGDVLLGENFSDPQPVTAVQIDNLRRGKVVTADVVLDSPKDRQRLAQTTGALAVDMETQVVHANCRLLGVPMLSLRAITDTPQFPFPAPPRVLFDIETQRTNPMRLTSYLMAHPRAVPKLIAFSRRVVTARRSLTKALDQLLRAPLV